MKALILCGGRGKRLRPYTDKLPKPLLKVAGKPILEYQVELLRRHNIKQVVFCVGYLADKIISYFGDGSRFGIKAVYVKEDPEDPLGTAGPIKNAQDYIDETFLVLNGDIITNMNLTRMVAFHVEKKGIATISLVKLKSPYGVVDVNVDWEVKGFKEKPLLPYYINAGIYVFEPRILRYIPERGMLETDVFPRLLEKGEKIYGYNEEGVLWREVGTYKDLEETSKEIEEMGGSIWG